MNEQRIFEFFSKRYRLVLLLIIFLAFLFRSIPAWTNAAWGNDVGIYYGLTNSFVKYGTVFSTYDGWGGSYEYFPVLYVVGGVVHLVTGLSIMRSLTYTAPIFGALTVLMLFMITNAIFRNKRLALLAAAFLAVNPLHLYQTSHAAPLTIGHFFMLMSLYFFLRYSQKKTFLVPLVVSSILLIMSHHLTTYMYIISLGGIILFKNVLAPCGNRELRSQLLYLLGFSMVAFSYWLLVAGKYFNSFIRSGTRMLPLVVVVTFYMGLLFLLLLSNRLRRFGHRIKKPYYSGKYDSLIVVVGVSVILAVMVGGTFFITIPGTTAKLNWKVILVSVPLIVTVAFTVVGLVYLWSTRAREPVLGWIAAIFFSLTAALISQNKVLFSDRHFEYLMEPISVIAALGVYNYYKKGMKYRKELGSGRLEYNRGMLTRAPLIKGRKNYRRFTFILIAIVVISNAISSYPMRKSAGGFNEGYSDEFMDVLEWMKRNIDRNLTIATDHRLAQVVHGKGDFKNVTYVDEVHWLWFADNWKNCREELNTTNRTDLPPVSYVLIDYVMVEIGVQEQVGVVPVPMTPASYNKFQYYPFQLSYRNGTDRDHDDVDEKWAEVYEVVY